MEPEHAEVVARLSEGRYLARCSCNGGTYHLHWDAATFRLTPEGLTFLAQVLEDLLAQGNERCGSARWALGSGRGKGGGSSGCCVRGFSRGRSRPAPCFAI